MDVFSFLLVVYMLKVLAEDTWHGVKGTPNPRHAARERRRKTRARSRTWGALTTYWGDLVEDAAAEATEHRRRKAERKRRERAEREAAELADPAAAPAEPETPGPAEGEEPVDLDLDDPKEETPTEPIPTEPPGSTSPEPGPTPDNVIPFPAPRATAPKEQDMATTEVTGLDPAIEYAKALASYAAEHAQAGNEGYIGFLTQSKVQGSALSSAHEMQEAFAAAAAAAERHKGELEKQKTVQEAYNTNPDAGDKAFQQNGQ